MTRFRRLHTKLGSMSHLSHPSHPISAKVAAHCVFFWEKTNTEFPLLAQPKENLTKDKCKPNFSYQNIHQKYVIPQRIRQVSLVGWVLPRPFGGGIHGALRCFCSGGPEPTRIPRKVWDFETGSIWQCRVMGFVVSGQCHKFPSPKKIAGR